MWRGVLACSALALVACGGDLITSSSEGPVYRLADVSGKPLPLASIPTYSFSVDVPGQIDSLRIFIEAVDLLLANDGSAQVAAEMRVRRNATDSSFVRRYPGTHDIVGDSVRVCWEDDGRVRAGQPVGESAAGSPCASASRDGDELHFRILLGLVWGTDNYRFVRR